MMNTRTFLATLSILLPAAHLAGDSIQLKRSTRMKHADARITLGDIATIEGDYAGRFASVVVDRMVDHGRPAEVTLEEVTRALDRAGANWARLELNGGTSIVRPHPRHRLGGTDPEACLPLELDGGETASGSEGSTRAPVATTALPVLTIDPREIVEEDSPRGLIAMRMAELWRGTNRAVRIHLQSARTSLLDETDLRPRVVQQGAFRNGTGRFSVLMEEEGVIEVEACLEVERLVVRASEALERGTRVRASDIESRTEWVRLSGNGNQHSILGTILGGELARGVKAGTPLEADHFVPAIRRNDPIRVRSGSSEFNLTLECISLEEGHVGEVIEVRPDVADGRSRKARPLRVVILDSTTAEIIN